MTNRRAFTPPAVLLLLLGLLLVLLPDDGGRRLRHAARRHDSLRDEEETLRRALLLWRSFPTRTERRVLVDGPHRVELHLRRLDAGIRAFRLRLLPGERAARPPALELLGWIVPPPEGATHPPGEAPRPGGIVLLPRSKEDATGAWLRWIEGLEAWDRRRRFLATATDEKLRNWLHRLLAPAPAAALPRELPSACRALQARLEACSSP